MEQVILVRFGEIFLKGENKGWFERVLLSRLRAALEGVACSVEKTRGRYLVSGYDPADEPRLIGRIRKVFGIHSLSPAVRVPTDLDEIFRAADEMLPAGTFKVETNRADKRFPMRSVEISRALGGRLLDARPGRSVDVHRPAHVVSVDMREDGSTYVFTKVVPCERGMPYGTGGKGVLLLSGGIDSPVAGYLMAKRGMELVGLHFHSYPYTSEMAREKVLSLARILCEYVGSMRLYVVSVTEIQTEIHAKCHNNFLITILRRFMMRIASKIAERERAQALITGESLAQVASQTAESIVVTNAVATCPVLRPLIGTDKQDIVEISKAIGAFETSIQPYEDCCTVFLPKNPVTHPRLDPVRKEEEKLDVDALVSRAMDTLEVLEITAETAG